MHINYNYSTEMMDSIIVNPSNNHAGVLFSAFSFLELMDDFIIFDMWCAIKSTETISFSLPKRNAVDSIYISRSNYLSAFRTWKSRIC